MKEKINTPRALKTPAHSRLYGLDILRATAILLVIYQHFGIFFPGKINAVDGVGIFFVLSGYLIGGIIIRLIETSEFSLNELLDFWKRRWLRTLPAYYTVITVLLFKTDLKQFLFNVKSHIDSYTFTQSIFNGQPRFYPESWSLAIEEWFYFLIPFIILLVFTLKKDHRKKTLLVIIVSTIVVSTVFRNCLAYFAHFNTMEEWQIYSRKATITRLDSIMYGFLGAYLFHYKSAFWNRKNLFFCIGIVMLAVPLFFRSDAYNIYFSITEESLAVLFLLPKLTSIRDGKGAIFNVFTYISKVSYSMYLINLSPFIILIYPLVLKMSGNVYIDCLLYLLWILSGASLLYVCIEKPFMNLRNRLAINDKGKSRLVKLVIDK